MNTFEYQRLIDDRVKECFVMMEDAEKKYNEARATYESVMLQKKMFHEWVKEGNHA